MLSERTAVLIEPSALARAHERVRKDRSPGGACQDPVLSALRASNARARQRELSLLPGRAPSWNLFVIQTCLFELALSVLLERSTECLEALSDLIAALDAEGTSEEHLPSELHAAFVIVGLAVALELAGEELDAAVRSGGREAIERLARRLAGEVEGEAWGGRAPNRAAWNHSIIAFAGLGVAGLALPEHSSSEDWVEQAVERSLLFFEHGITDAGMTREGLCYCGFVFRNLFPFLLGARVKGAFDYRDPEQNPFLTRLARVPQWYAGEVFPCGSWLRNLNDSYWDPRPALAGFLPVFGPLDKELTTWIWRLTLGEQGLRSYGADDSLRWSSIFESMLWGPSVGEPLESEVQSAPCAGEFFCCEDVGYLREWSADRRWGFSFNCGPYIGSIHDQSDNNSFTLFAEGVPFVLDAGAANRPEEGSLSSSWGHSAIVIDGRGQAPSGAGDGVSATLERIERSPTRTVVSGDAAASYSRGGYNPVKRATRTCLFAHGKEPYLLICDDIEKDGSEHEYEFLLHTPTPSESRIDGQRASLSIDFDGISALCEILVLEPSGASIASEPFATPRQPPFEEHTLWRVAATAVNPHFVILLTARPIPQPEGLPPLDAGADRDRSETEGR